MAKARVAATLDEMLQYLDASASRKLLDSKPQLVTITVADAAQAFKEGYMKAVYNKREAKQAVKFTDETFTKIAQIAVDEVKKHVAKPRTLSNPRYQRKYTDRVVFTQPRLIQSPFSILKRKGLDEIDKRLKEAGKPTLTSGRPEADAKGNKKVKERAGVMQYIQRLHGKEATGAAMLLDVADISKGIPGWEEFATSEELKTLTDRFGKLKAILNSTGKKKGVKFDEKNTIWITVEASEYNPSGDTVGDWGRLKPRLEQEMLKWAKKQTWPDKQGSNTLREDALAHARYYTLQGILKGTRKVAKKPRPVTRPKKKVDTDRQSSPRSKAKGYKSKTKAVRRKSSAGNQQGASLYTVMAMINEKLPQTVRKNMGAPRLENQTGKFANSVKMTDVIQTPQGYPSFGYTYAKEPYQVYETGSSGNWSSSERDPRKLIDASIREIAAGFALGRFYTRRE